MKTYKSFQVALVFGALSGGYPLRPNDPLEVGYDITDNAGNNLRDLGKSVNHWLAKSWELRVECWFRNQLRDNPKGHLEVGLLYRDSHTPCQA